MTGPSRLWTLVCVSAEGDNTVTLSRLYLSLRQDPRSLMAVPYLVMTPY